MTVTGTPSSSSALVDKVIALVKDVSAKLTNPDDFDAALASALLRYSKHRPGISVADITGDGTHDYSLPADWEDEFSAIKSIEYPVGDVPETLLDNDEYSIYRNTTVRQIRLINAAPSASESFRVTFTIKRTETTVPDVDEDAVCQLAASIALEMLANRYLDSSDPTINADVVNYRTKSQEAASRAKRLLQLYKEHMGIREDDTAAPASSVVSLEQNYPGGADRLTHPRWARRKR